MARGYHRRPELTADRFLPDPFAAVPGARLYRAGDRARWRADGSLEFLGRADQQVKVRSYRVEPGEVESVLAEHPGVREAVVLAPEGLGGSVCCGRASFRPGRRPPPRSCAPSARAPPRAHGTDRVPDAGGASALPTGKVDRHALARLHAERAEADRPYTPPRTAVETAIAGIWEEVLGVERVGIHDNFFELGGHSILLVRTLVRTAARIQEAFRTEIPIRPFFEAPTVAALSALLVERETKPGQVEKIAVVFNRIFSMSAQEVTRALQGSTSAGSG